jgi:hypothetical protein
VENSPLYPQQLTLRIGANTAIFSVVNAVKLSANNLNPFLDDRVANLLLA